MYRHIYYVANFQCAGGCITALCEYLIKERPTGNNLCKFVSVRPKNCTTFFHRFHTIWLSLITKASQ